MHRSAYPVHRQSHCCTGQCILSTNSPTVAQVSVSCPQTVPLMHGSAYPFCKQFPGLLLKPLYFTPFSAINGWSLIALRVPTCDSCMVLSPGCLNAFHHIKIFSFSWTLSATWGQAFLCSRMMLPVNLPIVFVLDLFTQFLKCTMTIMVWLMYRLMAQCPEARVLQWEKKKNAYRVLVEKPEE